jgi:hypothetical protein
MASDRDETTRKRVPYPLRAAKISVDFMPFGFWWRPNFCHRRTMTEQYREQGETIWWARWAWFQIRYSRWV